MSEGSNYENIVIEDKNEDDKSDINKAEKNENKTETSDKKVITKKEGFFSTSTFANSYLNISILTTNCVQIKYIATKNNWNDLNKALIGLIAISLILQIIHGVFLLLIASLKKLLINIKYNSKNLSKNLINELSKIFINGLENVQAKNEVKESIKIISNYLIKNNLSNEIDNVDSELEKLGKIVENQIHDFELKNRAFKAIETLKVLKKTFNISKLNNNLKKEINNFKNMIKNLNLNENHIINSIDFINNNEKNLIELGKNIQQNGLSANAENLISNIMEHGLNDTSNIFSNFLYDNLNVEELKNKSTHVLDPLIGLIDIGLNEKDKEEAKKAIEIVSNFIKTGLNSEDLKKEGYEAIQNLEYSLKNLDQKYKPEAFKAIEVIKSIIDLATEMNNLKNKALDSAKGFTNIFEDDDIKIKIDIDFRRYSTYLSFISMFIVLAISILNIIINIFLYGLE